MITGTFLDEITKDIPSANWGPEEWRRDFAAMKADGIDTVILARAGYKDRATFDSPVLRKRHAHLIVQEDLVSLFLGLAKEHGMSLWFGTYDSGELGRAGKQREEADLNRALADEVWERYGRSSAFRGWYLSHELDGFDEGALQAHESLSAHLRQISGLPILISPRLGGAKQSGTALTPAGQLEQREQVFARLAGQVDVVAFQDGHVPFAELPDHLAVNAELARKHGIASWSNVESFDRDVLIQHQPIAWPKLRYRLECAQGAGVDKLITFEYSHFLSPNSVFPAAHALHRRYREWLAKEL